MTYSKLCMVALFMRDTENVKNFCKTKVDANCILPRGYHIFDGL